MQTKHNLILKAEAEIHGFALSLGEMWQAEDRLKWLLKAFYAGEPVPEHTIGRLEAMAAREGTV